MSSNHAALDHNRNARKTRRMPAFLDHFNARDLKIFFRCWVAAWVAALLMFINPVASNFGSATFFACLVLFMVPPSGVLFVYILGSLSLLIGICLAWAWGVITMKAALAARSDTQARLLALQQTVMAQAQATGSPAAGISQRLIYDGWMLDARVTAIVYCMVCVFLYFMARLRAANPKTTLTAIFAIIISDLFLLYVPVLPSFNGQLPLALVKPAASGVGLGLACSFLLFPRSTSDIALEGIEDLLELLKSSLQFSSSALSNRSRKLDVNEFEEHRTGILKVYQKLEPSFAFLPLDFSISSWGAEAVGTFKEPLRHLVAAILVLSDFHKSTLESLSRVDELQKPATDNVGNQSADEMPRKVGVHHLSQLANFVKGLHYTDDHSINQDMRDELSGLSARAMDACLEGLMVTGECVQFVGRQHWYHKAPPSTHEELYQRTKTVLKKLRDTRTAFLHDMTEALVSGYAVLLESDNPVQTDLANQLAGIIICMNFQEHMANALEKTEALLARMSDVFPDATRPRLWWPTSLKYAAQWMLRTKGKAPTMASTSDDNPDETPVGDATQAAQEKLRIRRGYRPRTRHPLGKAIIGTYHWLTCDEGLYALRMVVVTIAVSIPGVLPHTAGFYYRERGLWGLIMAQTGLLVYMADFTFSVIARLAGTIGGGVLGLLAWYIGSGNGPGNPYGLSAILAVMLPLFLWVRLYLPPSLLQGGIMGTATFLLVIGYSYVDTHTPTYGDPGVGYNVFWRRLLLVLIGVAASTIVQILPRPPSSSRHVCKSLSRSLRTLSDHYALLLSCWGRVGDEGKTITEPIWLDLTESLVQLRPIINTLRFEFSSSPFDAESLGHVKQICHAINGLLARLLSTSATLPQEYKDRLAQNLGLLDHRCIGEIMAVLGVCEQALRTGDAPPEILPTPLVRRALEHWQSHQTEYILSAEMVREEDYRRYCVALGAYVRFVGKIDELVLVIKGVLGEAHLVSKDLIDLV